MLQVTEKASEMITNFLKDRKILPISGYSLHRVADPGPHWHGSG